MAAKEQSKKKTNLFNLFAEKVANIVGNAWMFCTMLLLVAAWLISGPFCR
ncbi:MAG: hypothetical protein AB7I18_04310 [Candidatus Berkiella sp.]